MLKNKYLLVALSLILIGLLFAGVGKAKLDTSKEVDLFQKYYQTVDLYEKIPSSEEERVDTLIEVDENFTEIALYARQEKLAAIALYSLGTIWFKEFLKEENNISNLKKAIVYLQESLRRDPDLDRAKRNLERAWRKDKEEGLMDELGFLPENGEENQDNKGQASQGEDEEGNQESKETGSKSINEPLPYDGEEGFGRGERNNDY